MAEESKNYLDELGLTRFWEEKIKKLIFRKATLQQPLEIKNPRVKVNSEALGHTFDKGESMEEIFKYLYCHVYPETNPNIPYTLPTTGLKITSNVEDKAELGDTIVYAVERNTFAAGSIGTCVAPWQEEAHQSTTGSGSTVISNSLRVYSGTVNDPEQCNVEETVEDGKVLGEIQVNNIGANPLNIYYCGTVGYNESTATSKTSYGNIVSPAIAGVTYFGEGVTAKSNCVTKTFYGYLPAFGNVSDEPTELTPTTISNLGDKFNKEGEFEFYYGKVNTSVIGTPSNFNIYFPAEFVAEVKYYDTVTQHWETVDTVIESGKHASLPAKDDTSKYPDVAQEGENYKLIKQAQGYAYGARRYKLILSTNS